MRSIAAPPILRWPGGKTQLLGEIMRRMPPSFHCLHEPFIGGGALSFALGSPGSFLSDFNAELINFYTVLKQRPQALARHLRDFKMGERFFYKLRAADRAADFAAARGTLAAQPYTRLLWFYTVHRSQGELLPGLERGGRYKLARYPQSEREFAKHFRISTFMMKDFASLDDIAEASGAPLSDVIDYVNAYSAVGYVENDRARFESTDARGRLRNPFAR